MYTEIKTIGIMETLINSNQAFLNIVSRAILNGYELNNDKSIADTLIEAGDFIINNCEVNKLEYCAVIQHGTSQHVEYADGLGTIFTSDGEIIGWQDYKNAKPNEQYIYATFVNVKGEVISLYENLNLQF